MGRPNFLKPPYPTHPLMSSASHSSTRSPDLITLRHKGNMVYTPPPISHQDAIKQAREEFADELATFDDRQFCFTVAVTVHDQKETVNISPRAWKTLMARLKQYEIVDITIRPLVVIQTADDVPPPQYTYGDEKHGESLSREPSPTYLDSRSRSPSRPGSPSLRSRAIGWIERRVGGSNDT